jgi:diguanylate cyclase (GGDEF)-like protein
MRMLTQLFRKWYEALLARIMPGHLERHSEEADDIGKLLKLALLACLVVICFVAEYMALGAWELALPLALAGIVMAGSPWIYKQTGSLPWARESFLGSLFLFKLWEAVYLASVTSPGTMWFLALPLAGILLGSVVSGISWLLVSTGCILFLYEYYGDNNVFTGGPIAHPALLYTFSLIFLGFSLVAFVMTVDASRKKAFRRLKRANEAIREAAIRDPLTGVFNRRYIWERMEGEERRALTAPNSFYICLIDIDRFKQINDAIGHLAGDFVLQGVAKAIESEVREDDCFGRYGGEEFILLLRSRNTLDPESFAERIRHRVAGLHFAEVPTLDRVTVSIGLAQFLRGEGFSKTISRADCALYAAKASGRNRVVVARESLDVQ